MSDLTALCETAARVATGLLGWTPEQFWQATPQELRQAVEGRLGRGAAAAFGRADLAALMARLPDEA